MYFDMELEKERMKKGRRHMDLFEEEEDYWNDMTPVAKGLYIIWSFCKYLLTTLLYGVRLITIEPCVILYRTLYNLPREILRNYRLVKTLDNKWARFVNAVQEFFIALLWYAFSFGFVFCFLWLMTFLHSLESIWVDLFFISLILMIVLVVLHMYFDMELEKERMKRGGQHMHLFEEEEDTWNDMTPVAKGLFMIWSFCKYLLSKLLYGVQLITIEPCVILYRTLYNLPTEFLRNYRVIKNWDNKWTRIMNMIQEFAIALLWYAFSIGIFLIFLWLMLLLASFKSIWVDLFLTTLVFMIVFAVLYLHFENEYEKERMKGLR
jgi:uncharacterized membrane protein YfcA